MNKEILKEPQSTYLSIVVPLFNEADSVQKLVAKITEVCQQFDFKSEIILIDDGSTDGTWQIIENLKITHPDLIGIKFSRNFGQTNAMVAGIDNASGEIIITIDGDLQNDPSDIPILLKKIDEGYDIVSGWRKKRKDGFSRVLPSKIANFLISITIGIRLHDYGCSLKAYKADFIKPIKAYGEMHRFFPALASMTGAKVTEVPVKHFPREYGVSKYGLNRIFKVSNDIFTVNLIVRFSANPIKGFSLSAIPFILLSLCFGFLGVLALILNWTPGKAIFFIMASALCWVTIVQLIMLGVLGELVIKSSDLEHLSLPEIAMKKIKTNLN